MLRHSIVITLAAAFAAPLAAQQPVAFVNANLVDPALGAQMGRTVVVQAGKITYVGAERRVPDGARVVDVAGRFLVPGLIDAHVHVRDFASARRALLSGVTTARSMGVSHFADVGLRELGRQGAIDAPEILAAGYHVRPELADEAYMDAPELSDLRSSGIRGEEAMRRVARLMIARGVNFIKTNATERAGLPETDPRTPYYAEAELRALVDEASRARIPVAAHAHGDGGGRAAVAAGVRSIEHGTYLSPMTLDLMVERGTFLVPTIAVVSDLTQPGGDYDNAVLQVRGRHMLPRVREMARRAHQKGVKIVAATDTGYGTESVLRLSHELIELVGIGMTPLEAVRAATTTAADLLGVADRTGRIAVGLEGDLLVLERNPLDDIGAYQDVLLVMTNGKIVIDRTAF